MSSSRNPLSTACSGIIAIKKIRMTAADLHRVPQVILWQKRGLLKSFNYENMVISIKDDFLKTLVIA